MWTAKVRHKRTGSTGIAEVNDDGKSATVTFIDGSVNLYHKPEMKNFFKSYVELKDGEHCAEIVNLSDYRYCKENGLDYHIMHKG